MRKGAPAASAGGDWRVYRSRLDPGGFSFEYFNSLYPDVDDTAAALLAFMKQDPCSVGSVHVVQATEWILFCAKS